MELLYTKEVKWLDEWDNYLIENDLGSHLLYSNWLKSYTTYGFAYEILILKNKDKIIGGFGAVIAKSLFFKFYIVPHGPIVSLGYEKELDKIIASLKDRAKKLNCCYVQYSLPLSNDTLIEKQTYSHEVLKSINNLGKKGNLFKYVYSSYGINWVDFNTNNNADELLLQLSSQVRRNINLSYKNNAIIEFASTEKECRSAYLLIEENAKEGGYAVRSFNDFKDTILEMVAKKSAFLMTAKVGNEIKGCAFFVKSGNHFTYISGGTKKEKPDMKIGYLLHWEIIKKSFQSGFSGYNISMGGSKGVVEFKAKFNTKALLFEAPHYHVILSPLLFKIYLILNSIFVKNKKTVSVLLKRFK
jgi:lipid II:glycine glycyltransferase (peptidoglycan interpeptide bridge formation enzyme)